jgi:PAT family beta-lactamase induction signal transducer AmpG
VGEVGTRRTWIVVTQLVGAVLMLGLAGAFHFGAWTLLAVILLGAGLASASHDTAADGFYMLTLDEHRQAEWTGIRNTFYRMATIAGTGGVVWMAGTWENSLGIAPAWEGAFALVALTMGTLALYHQYMLPKAAADARVRNWGQWLRDFVPTWISFVRKPQFGWMFAFMLLYRVGELQLLKGNQAFFLASRDAGGLALSLDEIAFLYGTLGVAALLAGGIWGGLAIGRTGLRRQLWPMALAINLPHVVYVWLAWAQPESRWAIGAGVVFEQLGYGYGYAAYMAYLLYISRGERATAHYSICTGVMALGRMLAGYLAAGVLKITADVPGQVHGYLQFFVWVTVCALISFAVVWKLPLAGDFGRRKERINA